MRNREREEKLERNRNSRAWRKKNVALASAERKKKVELWATTAHARRKSGIRGQSRSFFDVDVTVVLFFIACFWSNSRFLSTSNSSNYPLFGEILFAELLWMSTFCSRTFDSISARQPMRTTLDSMNS